MQSTFSGIEIGKRSLIAHNQGLVTTGHNLGNASVEGYSRQRVNMQATDPIYRPQLNREETPGQIGQGVGVARIERLKDMLLEGRIVSEGNAEGYWSTRDKYVLALEQIYNEPSESSTRSMMDKFWESWQELSVHPGEMAARQAVVARGEAFTDSLHARFRRLSEVRDMLDSDVRIQVGQVNAITDEIAKLNGEIVRSRAVGDEPNDLLDRRDLLVNKLSSFADVEIDGRDRDEFMVHTGGIVLVQGQIARKLEAVGDRANDGYSRVVWSETGSEAKFRGGSLAALVELRDGDVRSEIQTLDELALTFTDLVNETHREAYGLNGKTGTDFFVEYPFVNNISGNYDANGDGAYDSTYLHRVTGTNPLQATEQVGISGTVRLPGKNGLIDVQYRPTDTVGDLLDRINSSGAEVTARLDRSGRLQLRATPADDSGNPDFVIRHLEDSGQFLSGYSGILRAQGPDGAFRNDRADAVLGLRGNVDFAVAPLSHPSGWIGVNLEVKNDLTSIAAGFGENGRAANSGDGSAALAIASLRNGAVMVGSLRTFDDHFSEAVARIGLKGETADRALETSRRVMKDLADARDSVSGVNIDEEFSQMIKFQHGYNAAARFIANFNEMLDTVINRMGV